MTLSAYQFMWILAMFDLPVQSPHPMEGCAFEVVVNSSGEGSVRVTVLDMLIGFDSVDAGP